MDINTFGSAEQYEMLVFLSERMSLINEKKRKKLSSLINDFLTIVKKTETITEKSFKNYVLDLIHDDFKKRINKNIHNNYDDKIVSYLENFIYTKIRSNKII